MLCPRFTCPNGTHNDLATLFLSNTHETIIALFGMGANSSVPICDNNHNDMSGFDDLKEAEACSESFVPYFSIGSLALYTTCYVVLMSIGAGLAIPGGLFMPSIVVSGNVW